MCIVAIRKVILQAKFFSVMFLNNFLFEIRTLGKLQYKKIYLLNCLTSKNVGLTYLYGK